jgi:hypothetical protein
MLKPEHYEQWKEMEITFDPRILSATAVQEDNQ